VTIRHGPKNDLPGTSLTLGTMLTIAGWVIGSLAFGFYLSEIASVANVFGNLATIYIFVQYLFGLSAILLAGLSVDAALQNSDGGAEGS
jgi:membrane protein